MIIIWSKRSFCTRQTYEVVNCKLSIDRVHPQTPSRPSSKFGRVLCMFSKTCIATSTCHRWHKHCTITDFRIQWSYSPRALMKGSCCGRPGRCEERGEPTTVLPFPLPLLENHGRRHYRCREGKPTKFVIILLSAHIFMLVRERGRREQFVFDKHGICAPPLTATSLIRTFNLCVFQL